MKPVLVCAGVLILAASTTGRTAGRQEQGAEYGKRRHFPAADRRPMTRASLETVARGPIPIHRRTSSRWIRSARSGAAGSCSNGSSRGSKDRARCWAMEPETSTSTSSSAPGFRTAAPDAMDVHEEPPASAATS